MNYPTNNDDVIDSRDVIEAIEQAYAEYVEACEAENLESHDHHMWEVQGCPTAPTSSDHPEMVALVKLSEGGEDYSEDWEYGATLIRDSYFTDYARELHADLSGETLEHNHGWPYTCIDWEWAARELKHDYTAVDFDGVTYWVR